MKAKTASRNRQIPSGGLQPLLLTKRGVGVYPAWANPNGVKVVPNDSHPSPTDPFFDLRSPNQKAKLYCHWDPSEGGWKIVATVYHNRQTTAFSTTTRLVKSVHLLALFGVMDRFPGSSRKFLADVGGEVGVPGLGIRWRNWMNFPGPGFGHDGDPNITIFLSPMIKAIVGAVVQSLR